MDPKLAALIEARDAALEALYRLVQAADEVAPCEYQEMARNAIVALGHVRPD
jgi:hypothetical protein